MENKDDIKENESGINRAYIAEIVDEKLKKSQLDMLASRTKTIKVDVRTWDSLKSMRKENETFNDVIKELLNKRTKSIGDENIKAIKYQRKTDFSNFSYDNNDIGYEFEYNDVKGDKSDFVLDLKIKKIFVGRKSASPSEFFGVDNEHKHYSYYFLTTYLSALSLVFMKEFKVYLKDTENRHNLASWRKLYYDYNLSEESFRSDIEEPLRLSEEEKPSEKWKKRMVNSAIEKLAL